MRFVVLLTLILWLFVCVPQDAFLWASTTHDPGSFDWVMGYARALVLGFLPILTVWVEGILDATHIGESKEEYKKRRKAWTRKETRYGDDWARQNPLIDEDEFINGYATAAKRLSRWVPWMFALLNTVISLSYLGYYEEYGKDIKMFHILIWGMPVGEYVLRPLTIIMRTTITWVVGYVLGKIAAVLGVQDLPKDVQTFFESFLAPREPVSVQTKALSPYATWPDRDVEARHDMIVKFVKDTDPERTGIDREEIFDAVHINRLGKSACYKDVDDLIKANYLSEIENGKVTWKQTGF